MPGQPLPADVRAHLEGGGKINAWNTAFERWIIQHIATPRFRWPRVNTEQFEDTMVWAMAMSLPASLGQCAFALGIENLKDDGGHRLMLQMAKPRRVLDNGRAIWWDDKDRLARLVEYCRQDVRAERDIARMIFPLSATEQANWLESERINDRGVHLDLPFVKIALDLAYSRLGLLDRDIHAATKGAVQSINQVARLGEFMRDQGYPMASLDKESLEAALIDPNLPEHLRKVLETRQRAAKSSVKKLIAMQELANTDARARGLFQFHRAGTGRWASSGIQFQNLPRTKHNMDELCKTIIQCNALNDGFGGCPGLEMLDVLYDDVLSALSQALRGCITPASGRSLVVADYAQIEARILAWLCGQMDVVQAFFAQDAGTGKDAYVYTAQQMGSNDRQLGKVVMLACGYGMGAEKFRDTAATYGLDLDEEFAEEVIEKYRAANPHIYQGWYKLQDAAVAAITTPGQVQSVFEGRIKYIMHGAYLWCQLPSGRTLCYPYARAWQEEKTFVSKKTGEPYRRMVWQIEYWGTDSKTRQWAALRSYGGHLCENIVQAIAADILRMALRKLRVAGFSVVMHIHDEVVCEIPDSAPLKAALKAMTTRMSEVPAWLEGCPLSAQGYVAKRYRKG